MEILQTVRSVAASPEDLQKVLKMLQKSYESRQIEKKESEKVEE